MNRKNIVIGGVVLVALGLIGWLALRNQASTVDNTPSPTPTATPKPTPRPVLHTVSFTGYAFVPPTLTIRVGDAVSFTNTSSIPVWPVSSCAGFDAQRALQQGETYTLTFTSVRTCTYHDRLDTAITGTIIVR